jgi:TP901 family phage tail tape measure protein
MAGSLGTIAGTVRLDVSTAIAAFATLRTASAASTGALTTAGTRLSTFGKVATGAGLALVAAFAVAINKAAEFEKKMDYFGAVNNATADQMEKVRKKALELGRTSQYSANQIADAFVEMGKAGVSVTDITDGMAQAVVNLASAADIDLARATNIVTSQIQAYDLTAKDAAHVTNLLAGAANASIVDVEDLGVSLKYVGGVAHALGISFDSTIDALSLLGKAGLKGSTAGTSLRQIMVSLAGGTNKAKGELEDLGIITKDGTNLFFDATGKAKSLAEVFQILQDHTRGLTQKEQLMAFRTIFNNRALAAAEILTKNGAKGFASMNAEISKTTAADVAAKRMDNLSGDIKKLKGNIDTLLIQAGTPFQNFLRGIVQSITRVVQVFARLPSGMQTGILAFIGITGVILTFLGAVALIGGTILKAAAVFKQLWAAMKLMVTITRVLTVATWEMTVAALSNPYVILAVAVVALVVAMIVLYKKSDKFRQIMDATGRGIKTGFMATVNWFKGLPKFFENLWNDIANWFAVGVGWVKKNWDILAAILLGPIGGIILVWHRFGDDIVNFFASIPTRVTGALSTAMTAVLGFLQNLPYKVGYALGFVIGTIVKWGFDLGKAVAQAGIDMVNMFIYSVTVLPMRVASILLSAYNGTIQWGKNMIMATTKAAIDTYNGVVNWFQKLPGRLAGITIDTKNRVVSGWNATLSASRNFAVNAYNAVVDWFSKLPGRIYSFVSTVNSRVISAGAAVVRSAGNFASSAYNAIYNGLVNLPSLVWDILGNVIDAFQSMVQSAYNSAKNFAGGLWDGFKKGLGINSPSYIERQMTQITQVTDQESRKLAKQVNTLQSMAGSITEKNPARSIQQTSLDTIMALTRQMQEQAQVLASAASTMFPTTGTLHNSGSKGNSSPDYATQALLGQRPIEVNVYNPVAEKTSESTAKKLRTLSSMGAF